MSALQEAPLLTANNAHLLIDGAPMPVDSCVGEEQRVCWLPEVAAVFANKRTLWLAINPSRTFHGVAILRLDAGVSATLFKSIIHTLTLVGFPNIALVVIKRGTKDEFGTLHLDGRAPGLAPWGTRARFPWLVMELRPDKSMLTWWRYSYESLDDRAETPLAELSAEVVRRWEIIAPKPPNPDAYPNRSVLRFRNDVTYETIVRVIDATSKPKRWFNFDSENHVIPAFLTTIGANPSELEAFHAEYARWTDESENVRREPSAQ